MRIRLGAALVAGALSLWLNAGAVAQNYTCPTQAVGDSETLCASTQFVQQNLQSGTNLSASIDAAFGSTRGSILERGASGWQIITPGTSGLPWASNGAGADPGYQALTAAGIAAATITSTQIASGTVTGGNIASATVANSNLANMPAGTHKCRETGNGTGAPQDCSYPIINVMDAPYSATGNGSTDDTTAIQNAINALPATGGDVVFPCGTYKVSSSLAIGNGTNAAASTRYGVMLKGFGNGRTQPIFAGFNTTPCVSILWAGSGSGGIISIAGPLQTWGVQNMTLNCNSVASSVGLLITSAQFGESRNLTTTNCFRGIQSTTVAPFGSFTNTDSFHNDFYGTNIEVPATASSIGILLTGVAAGTSNTDYNTFVDTWISLPTSVVLVQGIVLQSSDTNHFMNTHLSGSNSSGQCVSFDYSLVSSFPSANRFTGIDPGGINCNSGGSFTIGGTPGSGAVPNIVFMDEANAGACGAIATGNNTGNDILGAWSSFTATPACGTATIATTSARSNQIGKTTTLQLNATFSAIGTCTTTMTFTLPRTSNSAGTLTFIDSNSGRVGACRIGSGATTASCNFYDATQVFSASSNIFGSGVYENQ
jgi:hypothetical protein